MTGRYNPSVAEHPLALLLQDGTLGGLPTADVEALS